MDAGTSYDASLFAPRPRHSFKTLGGMTAFRRQKPVDREGHPVSVGTLVRVLELSGDWFEKLPPDERADVESMVGEVFAIEEIDEYGQPWVRKAWSNDTASSSFSHAVALEPHEMEVVEN